MNVPVLGFGVLCYFYPTVMIKNARQGFICSQLACTAMHERGKT